MTEQTCTFEQLGIEAWLSKQCAYMAMHTPTPIQQQCIPAILAGHHVAGGAATGSGKTAAFALPILQELSRDMYGVFALVLTASRELVYQILDQFVALGAPLRVRTMLAIGGVRHEEQLDALQARPHIVVATPGRLLHLLTTYKTEVLSAMSRLRYLVLDEADRLTEGDMQHDVRKVLQQLRPNPRRRVLLFSATLTPQLVCVTPQQRDGDDNSEDASWLQQLGVDSAQSLDVFDVAGVVTTTNNTTTTMSSSSSNDDDKAAAVAAAASSTSTPTYNMPSGLTHAYLFLPNMVKLPYLVAALRVRDAGESTIVFANSCMRVELVRLTLQLLGFPVCSLDAVLTQQQRLNNLALFKLGIAKVMVCTDIAARGLDIPSVSAVIHYDMPKHAATYVHRVGRTARAGRAGLSVAMVTEYDVELVHRIERKLHVQLTRWRERGVGEARVLRLLDEVSTAKIQAKQQVTEQFGNRVSTRKQQAAQKRVERQTREGATRRSSPTRRRQQQQQHNDDVDADDKAETNAPRATEVDHAAMTAARVRSHSTRSSSDKDDDSSKARKVRSTRDKVGTTTLRAQTPHGQKRRRTAVARDAGSKRRRVQ